MADRVLLIGWGTAVRGREERALEVFDEAVGILGRMQQEERIEKMDVVLLDPNAELAGFMVVHGSAEQLAALRQDEEFLQNTTDAELIVDGLRHIEGYTNEGVPRMMDVFRQAVAKVPQTA